VPTQRYFQASLLSQFPQMSNFRSFDRFGGHQNGIRPYRTGQSGLPLVSRDPPTFHHPLISLLLYDWSCDRNFLRDIRVSNQTRPDRPGQRRSLPTRWSARRRRRETSKTTHTCIGVVSNETRRRRRQKARVVPFPAA